MAESARRAAAAVARQLFGLCLGLALALGQGQASAATDITQLRVERGDDGVYLSAMVRFDLPSVVEDTLLKGIPLFFVVEAEIYRDRWYWTDRQVVNVARTLRLAYQPLTRRWRINIASGPLNNSAGLRASLNQNYDSLSEALAAIQRVARWRIAEMSDLDPAAGHSLRFSFRLDVSQLPRPFQIGIAGQQEWQISAEIRERLRLEQALPASVSEGAK